MSQTNTGPVHSTDAAAAAPQPDALADYQQLLFDRLECLQRIGRLREEFSRIEAELVQAFIAEVQLGQQIAAVEALRPDFKAKRVAS